jgi:glycosyltransferase involved in cell wall biosynthesis
VRAKIAIILDDLDVGGIPVSCISFLKVVSKYADVTLVVANDKGCFMNKVPEAVSVRVCPGGNASAVFRRLRKEKKYGKFLSCAIRYAFWGKIARRWIKASNVLAKEKGWLLDEEFDCAIAYHGMNIFQMNKTLFQIKAKKKIAWIQGDHPFEKVHKKDAKNTYESFDHIFAVSEEMKRRFLLDFPSVAQKTSVYYPHSPVDEIIEKSNVPLEEEFDKEKLCLVTVGRVSPEKGQDMIPAVLSILLKKGFRLQWYIVGDGADRSRIESLVKEANLEESVTFLGSKTNPYPYMRACDLYVQPSYTEGYSLTIFETAILHKPIVATDVGGARELLKNEEAILFVDPTPESIAAGIERMLSEEGLQEKIVANLQNRDFANLQELEKLMAVIQQ